MPATTITAPPNTPLPNEALLDAYLDAATTVARELGLPSGWCITAAGLSREVLTRLGLRGVRLVGVDVAAFNARAWTLMHAGVPMGSWPPEARFVATGGTDAVDATGWDGHVIAYVPSTGNGGNAWIVDPSATQFTHATELVVPPLRAAVPRAFLAMQPAHVPLDQGGLVVVRNHLLASHTTELTDCSDLITMLADRVERLVHQTLRMA